MILGFQKSLIDHYQSSLFILFYYVRIDCVYNIYIFKKTSISR